MILQIYHTGDVSVGIRGESATLDIPGLEDIIKDEPEMLDFLTFGLKQIFETLWDFEVFIDVYRKGEL
jgi:predicted ATPase